MRSTIATVLAVAATLSLSACGSGEEHDGGAPRPAATAAPKPAPDSAVFNRADVQFAQNMLPHHRQAVRMADMVPGHEASPQVAALAGRVRDAQQPEIDRMRGWLRGWGAAPSGGQHEAMSHPMPGMMSDQDMQALAAAQGPDFDSKWLRMMIQHHQGALDMARAEQGGGKNPQARQLAGSILRSQQAEIDEMNGMLQR